MKYLLLLLPNFYDIFTVLMILYAFMLNQQTPLPVSFGVVCVLAYVATRIGIIAGKLILAMIGQPPVNENEEPADMLVKRLVLGFGPQCVFVVICQVVLALGFLPHPNMVTAEPPQLLHQQQAAKIQVQNPEETSVESQNIESAIENTTAEETSAQPEERQIVKMEQPPMPEPTKTAVTTSSKRKISTSNRKSSAASDSYNNIQPATQIAYGVPERTLKAAGVSSADVAVNNSRRTTSTATYSAPSTTTAGQNKTSNNTNLNTKRYMGDDNPVSTSWGYYKKNNYPNVNNSAEQVNTVRSYAYNPVK